MALTPLSIDIMDTLQKTLDELGTFLPKLLGFLIILLIGWIIAKAAAKLLALVLTKLGFNTLLSKAGADDLLRGAQIEPIGLIAKLAYYFILLIALKVALDVLGITAITALVDDIVLWLPKLFIAIVIVVIAGAVANAVKDLIAAALGGVSYGPLVGKIAAGFIVALGVIAALNQVGIGTTVTMPVLIAVLATIGGILVVGVGGGLIRPMSLRWEGWLNGLAAETQKAKAGGGAHQAAAPTYTEATYNDPGTTPPSQY